MARRAPIVATYSIAACDLDAQQWGVAVQSKFLAVGSVAPRPVVAADGSLVARRTMDVTLSCDHRAVYGAEAARFLARVRELLEHATLLMVEG